MSRAIVPGLRSLFLAGVKAHEFSPARSKAIPQGGGKTYPYSPPPPPPDRMAGPVLRGGLANDRRRYSFV